MARKERGDSITDSVFPNCGTRVLLLMLILLFSVSPAGSVDIAGKIKGMVMDPSGAAVPGAKLTARNMATGVIAQTTSEKDGSYAFESLLPGNYEVTCEGGVGFKKFVTTNVQVISVETTAMNVILTLGGVTQTLQVTGAATMVGTENPTLESRLGPEALDTLPILGRDPRDTAELVLPGVAPGPASRDTGTEVVNGQRGASNNYRVDGTENIDYDYGESFNYPPVEDLAEFTVLTNASDAKYGSGAGAQVDAIVKSGTNNLHASAWAYLQNEAWDANSWQGNLTATPDLADRSSGTAEMPAGLSISLTFITGETKRSGFFLTKTRLLSGKRWYSKGCRLWQNGAATSLTRVSASQ